ncbi:MAG: hypothetical protein IPI83_04355 [Sphingomonadales bacterium]|nr:hypothetical protein [Sphingomonadales bacterium]
MRDAWRYAAMTMQKTLKIIFGLAIGFAQPAIASPELPSQQPVEILPLEVTADGLAGVGGERLRAELGDAQFVAVGEDHGFAGSPMLAAALGKELERVKGPPVYHVVEVGPFSTRHVSHILRKEGLAGLDRIVDEQPSVWPFLANLDDATLALPFAKSGRLWGIDQEFIGSAPLLFSLLMARTRDPEVRRQLADWSVSDRIALSKGKFDEAWMITADQSRFDALRSAFSGDKVGLRLIDALFESARIYKYNSAERYFENMGGAFALPARAQSGRGAYHLGRGVTPTSIFDIGSILPGLSAAQSRRSLHIAFIPLSGKVRSIAPTAQGFTRVSIEMILPPSSSQVLELQLKRCPHRDWP